MNDTLTVFVFGLIAGVVLTLQAIYSSRYINKSPNDKEVAARFALMSIFIFVVAASFAALAILINPKVSIDVFGHRNDLGFVLETTLIVTLGAVSFFILRIAKRKASGSKSREL